MFGYIRIYKNELLVREYEAYKSVYCGLCRCMGRDYSRLSRLILSYDCTFYAMFIMSLRRSCSGFECRCCRVNPFKKCGFCKVRDDAMSKAAALSVILAYYKLVDDIRDSSFLKRMAYRTLRPLFSHWRKKAKKRYPELDEIGGRLTSAQQKAEADPNCGIDMAADPTAQMLASVLRLEAQDEEQLEMYGKIGYGIGRFIYLIDAVDDYKKDLKIGNFNPFRQYKDDTLTVMKNNLSQALAFAYDAYMSLELVDFKGIIDNIMLKGLPTVQNEVLERAEV